MTTELRINELIAQIKRPDRDEKLDRYLQSFSKRVQYCDTYYGWFEEYVEPQKLMKDRFGITGELRTEYEAIAVAFVANLHALIDSAPWFIFQAAEPLTYWNPKKGRGERITERRCGWTEPFSQSLSPPCLAEVKKLFDDLRHNIDFKRLQTMSNQNKHSYLTRIKNNYTSLSFELMDPDTASVTNFDCQAFFQRTHDNLVPKVIDLFVTLGQACVKRERKLYESVSSHI